MKKKVLVLSTFLLLFTFVACSTSPNRHDTVQDTYDTLQTEDQSFELTNDNLKPENKELNEELEHASSDSNSVTDKVIMASDETTENISNESNSSYNDMSNGPSELELMSYAQTVLDNNLPGCRYSHNKTEYTFVKTNLRYKIEGELFRSKDASSEKFYMIIEFIDENYEIYDLISLQVGDEIIYESSSSNEFKAPLDTNDEILSEENTRIYNEVMEKLNADYSREEDEIFEEIAPDYNMTASQLKEFMWDYMEAYYQ